MFNDARKIEPNGKFVVISGCDTGLGLQLAIELDQLQFHVIAGVLQPNHIDMLSQKLSSRASVLKLDITNENDIDCFYQQVRLKTKHVHALINNSGLMIHSCIDWTSVDAMRKVMEVNFFGHVAMTKRFLDMLISSSHARVINIVSAAGFFVFPNTSAYSSSKHALRSFSDCLYREMSPWNLHVVTIEPGAIRTPMMQTYGDSWTKIWNEQSEEVQRRWGQDYFLGNLKKAHDGFRMIPENSFSLVLESIKHAVLSVKPNRRYLPDRQSQFIYYILYFLPSWLADLLISFLWNITPDGVKNQSKN